ncbi:hypothetical protein PHYBOEH_002327 [Phytophthora boehmeriae]|uniref:Uncharacterized protein n=1 Tax=Phytophthora boehmeriae TaxID=109152 RepID=A0A8T1V645_9STRA|nr:hypothetical protein PHYBOEH_002327 [Phytophthora boehmeriae]
MAADARQADDNSGRRLLSSGDRSFVNQVIHDPSMNYQPKYDKRLRELASRGSTNKKLHEDSSDDAHVGLGSAVLTVGALAAVGIASYWISSRKEQEHKEQEGKEQ